jgi:PLP dependent protein
LKIKWGVAKVLCANALVNTGREWYALSMSSVLHNIIHIQERIDNACARAGRDKTTLRLMAVSKLQPVERIQEAIDFGMRLFGESRVQETKERRHIFPPDAEVHLIGHLQRNKARDAVQLYNAVQSIDALRTIEALETQLKQQEITTPMTIFVEMNTSGEESKSGVRSFDELQVLANRLEESPLLNMTGLMTIGPFTDDTDRVRRAFSALREHRDRLEDAMRTRYPELSMGMSDDLEAAVLEGSTMLRIGTAIFGDRS